MGRARASTSGIPWPKLPPISGTSLIASVVFPFWGISRPLIYWLTFSTRAFATLSIASAATVDILSYNLDLCTETIANNDFPAAHLYRGATLRPHNTALILTCRRPPRLRLRTLPRRGAPRYFMRASLSLRLARFRYPDPLHLRRFLPLQHSLHLRFPAILRIARTKLARLHRPPLWLELRRPG